MKRYLPLAAFVAVFASSPAYADVTTTPDSDTPDTEAIAVETPEAFVERMVEEGLNDRHQTMLDELERAEDNEFDADYLTLQLRAHPEAIGLHENFMEGDYGVALHEFAEETLPALNDHLQSVQDLSAIHDVTIQAD